MHAELEIYKRVFYKEIAWHRARRPSDQRPNMILLEQLAEFLVKRGACLKIGHRYLFPIIDEAELATIVAGVLEIEGEAS